MDLAEKVADDATTVTQADIDRLLSLGLSDTEILNIVVAAAARIFFSKVLDGLGAQPDEREAAVGRTSPVARMASRRWPAQLGSGSWVGAYELGSLGATDEAADFYAARGWKLWQGPTSALRPTGIRRTEQEDGSIYVLPGGVPLDLSGELTCDWRDGDVW